jgi:hypothetical protein|tara:strand:+ start:1173 stop:1370 length:198 start_codon:yes stop_codon:yes gene_type:complete
MNDFSIFIYFICFAAISGGTFAFMWRMMTLTLNEIRNPYKKIHPELEDIKPGEELLVFKVKEKED